MVERHRTTLLRGIVAVVGSLLAGCSGVGTLYPGLHASAPPQHHAGCRDGMCDPHCPVRPGSDGFYSTQWRRRFSGRASKPDEESPTPAGAPRSIVPRADEESSNLGVQNLPPVDPPALPPPRTPTPPVPREPAPPSDAPRTVPPEEDNIFSSREAAARAALLASTASAARGSASDEQVVFTRRLAETFATEQDGGVRAKIIDEAANFQTPSADAICRRAAADPDPWVRTAACRAWEKRGGPEAVRFLSERAAQDADLGVRLRAIRGLGELRDPRATATLVTLLEDRDPTVQQRTCLALGRATGLALGDDPQRWRQWASQASRPQPRLTVAPTRSRGF